MNTPEKQTNPALPDRTHARPGRRDLALLVEAARVCEISQADFDNLIHKAGEAEDLASLEYDGLDRVMDVMVAAGFRHPEVPMLSAVQIAFVTELRKALGIDPIAFGAAMRERGKPELPHLLDGLGFHYAMGWLFAQGELSIPYPESYHVTRAMAAEVRGAWFWSPLREDDFRKLMLDLGGGAPRLRFLDKRQISRMLAWFAMQGHKAPGPAPRVPAEPGFITQPQANLIWKLWRELDGLGGDLSEEAFDRCLAQEFGVEGGLTTLTRRGATMILDRQLATVIRLRAEGDAAVKARRH